VYTIRTNGWPEDDWFKHVAMEQYDELISALINYCRQCKVPFAIIITVTC